MIIDFHTHVFPPDVGDRRDDYARRDPTFAEIYGSRKALIATADELLRSMDEAAVDVSVTLGFAWRDQEDCVRHNDYLLECAAASGGRIMPFCTANFGAGEPAAREVERCARAGALGLGELRPGSQGWSLDGGPGDLLANLASKHGLLLLFHVTEPGGREYPGKRGLSLESFQRFLARRIGAPVVGAHVGGGLPLHATTESSREAVCSAYYDTAALRFLYEPSVLLQAARYAGAERLLFGSDFPLIDQAAALADVRAAELDDDTLRAVLGENARRLLGLQPST